MKNQLFNVVAGIAAAFLASGCTARAGAPPAAAIPAVTFRIQEFPLTIVRDQRVRTWQATHEAGGKTARFRIELVFPVSNAVPTMTTGTLYREPQSEPSAMVADLAKVLQARRPPAPGNQLDRLPLNVSLLGQNLVRNTGASTPESAFTPGDGGTWIAAKVFVAEDEGEFYLNLDPAAGIGEIVPKGPRYGDIVTRELAKIL